MRILFWTTDYLPFIGGVEVFCHRLAKQLVILGHEVEVITYDRARETGGMAQDSYENITIYRLPSSESPVNITEFFKIFTAIKNLVTKFNPELIHVHGFGRFPLYQSRILTENLEIPALLTIHGFFLVLIIIICCCKKSYLERTMLQLFQKVC